ncbi:MAG: hypothetical protein F4138_04740 [Acidimicrobiia bacterium]|nr:hypothetical protein [Acidimicrobiia bacterium]MYC58528.1 hypothetical protein [Acidimicrobiia bacterium]MYG94286.1 hypothetical protein [Acidimicrobiia bacterium]MYI30365.1 hypothetical protein [Acidimicrobiia bacterium]
MARQNSDKFTLIGLGAQDSLSHAESFVSSTGTTFTMLWDSSGASWRELSVFGQPSLIVMDRYGRETDRRGGVSPSWILHAIENIN